MIIKNAKLWSHFQEAGECEICGEYFAKCEPHHHLSRTPELTIRCNLLRCGSSRPFPLCECHSRIEAGKVPPNVVLEKIAAREKQKVDDIETVLFLFRRLIKPTQSQLVKAVNELAQESARKLAFREIDEAGILA